MDFSFFRAAFCTVKTRHVLKRAWQEHSTEGYANMNRSWGHDEKVRFFSHDFHDFHHDSTTFSNLYILLLKALPMLFSKQVWIPCGYNQQK